MATVKQVAKRSVLGRAVPLLALGLGGHGCSGETQEHTEYGNIFSGTVTDDTGSVLLKYCASVSSPTYQVIQFAAAPGAHVVVEEVEDQRQYVWTGPGTSRNDPTSFWCSGGGQSTPMTGMFAQCLRVMGSDPPATLDRAEERGVPGVGGGVTGVALFLTIRHAGVLETAFDGACIDAVYHVTHDSTEPAKQLTVLAP